MQIDDGAWRDFLERLEAEDVLAVESFLYDDPIVGLEFANAVNQSGRLVQVMRSNNEDLIRLFVQHPEIDLHIYNEEAFFVAVEEIKNARVVDMLLTVGVDPNVEQHSALQFAVSDCNEEIVRVLLAHNADTTFENNQIILSAAAHSTVPILNLLLQEQPALAHMNQEQPLLEALAFFNTETAMDLITTHQANLAIRSDECLERICAFRPPHNPLPFLELFPHATLAPFFLHHSESLERLASLYPEYISSPPWKTLEFFEQGAYEGLFYIGHTLFAFNQQYITLLLYQVQPSDYPTDPYTPPMQIQTVPRTLPGSISPPPRPTPRHSFVLPLPSPGQETRPFHEPPDMRRRRLLEESKRYAQPPSSSLSPAGMHVLRPTRLESNPKTFLDASTDLHFLSPLSSDKKLEFEDAVGVGQSHVAILVRETGADDSSHILHVCLVAWKTHDHSSTPLPSSSSSAPRPSSPSSSSVAPRPSSPPSSSVAPRPSSPPSSSVAPRPSSFDVSSGIVIFRTQVSATTKARLACLGDCLAWTYNPAFVSASVFNPFAVIRCALENKNSTRTSTHLLQLPSYITFADRHVFSFNNLFNKQSFPRGQDACLVPSEQTALPHGLVDPFWMPVRISLSTNRPPRVEYTAEARGAIPSDAQWFGTTYAYLKKETSKETRTTIYLVYYVEPLQFLFERYRLYRIALKHEELEALKRYNQRQDLQQQQQQQQQPNNLPLIGLQQTSKVILDLLLREVLADSPGSAWLRELYPDERLLPINSSEGVRRVRAGRHRILTEFLWAGPSKEDAFLAGVKR